MSDTQKAYKSCVDFQNLSGAQHPLTTDQILFAPLAPLAPLQKNNSLRRALHLIFERFSAFETPNCSACGGLQVPLNKGVLKEGDS